MNPHIKYYYKDYYIKKYYPNSISQYLYHKGINGWLAINTSPEGTFYSVVVGMPIVNKWYAGSEGCLDKISFDIKEDPGLEVFLKLHGQY